MSVFSADNTSKSIACFKAAKSPEILLGRIAQDHDFRTGMEWGSKTPERGISVWVRLKEIELSCGFWVPSKSNI